MSSLRVNERDTCAARALTRLFVDELDALSFEVGKSRFQIVHAQGDMLNAAASAVFLDELFNRTARFARHFRHAVCRRSWDKMPS